MAEYWNIKDEHQEEAKVFFMHAPEPEMSLNFDIAEKDFTNAGKGSAELKNMLKRLGVNPEILRRIAVASYEAEINIAAHSFGGTMKSYIYPEFVYVTFNDMGPGIEDLDQAMTPGFSTADELVREMGFGAGLGLPNIKKNSDVMHLKSEKSKPTKLEIIIYFY
jgi:serine/threonine-protein kinase RsbT